MKYHPDKSSTQLISYINSYYNIIDYVPYAVLYIPVIIFITGNWMGFGRWVN